MLLLPFSTGPICVSPVAIWELTNVPAWIQQVTAPNQRVRRLAWAVLLDGDVAIVVLPARPVHDGEVAL